MRFICSIILFSLASVSLAQRPKVGLVLSGGGAKGFAHIGVIRELEKAGIKPDIITGTSMGSIVGALYSMGYTPDEMEKIVRVVNWDNVISNKLPYSKITMPEKPYDSRYITELGIEHGKISLPKGLIEGKELAMLMDMLTIPSHHIKDFSKMPIPFACVATDITTGQAVVLDSGNINEAIRASMAIPSIFTPIKLDGQLLVDGGLVRNFPVQQAIDMGAEYIIGSNVGGEFLEEDELNSMVDVLSQSAFVLSTLDTREQIKLCNLVITPPIKEFSAADFNLGLEIIKVGEDEAKKYSNQLISLADSLNQIGEQPDINFPKIDSSFSISKINVYGNDHLPAKIISKKLDFNPNKIYSNDDIIEHVTVLFGTKYFNVIHYNVIRNEDTTYRFDIKVKESPDGVIKGAFHFDSENGTGLNLNLTVRNLIFPYSRLITEIDIATQPRASINYLKYLGKRQNKFIFFDFYWQNFDLPIYEQGDKTSLWTTNYFNSTLQFNRTVSTHTMFGGAVGVNYLDLQPTINQGDLESIQEVKEFIPFVRLKFEINSLNKRYFSNRGAKLYSDLSYSNSLTTDVIIKDTNNINDEKTITNDQLNLNLKYKQYFMMSEKLSFVWQNDLSLNFSNNPSFSTTHFVGGFNPYFINTISFDGAHAYEFQANNIFVSKLGFQYEFYSNAYFIGNFNYAETEFPLQENNPVFDNQLDGRDRRFSIGLSLAYNSALGPISFSVGKDLNRNSFRTNFTFGFWYK